MTKVVLHPQTKADIEAYLNGKSHAVLINGALGAGKFYLAQYIAAQLLNIDQDRLISYPFLQHLKTRGSSIGVEEIRQLHNFLKLKTTGQGLIRRIVIIENAQHMTEEAQNSLLKALEEPPSDTVLVLTAINSKSILPTIVSRVQQISIKNPTLQQIIKQYPDKDVKQIEDAYKLSSGLLGLTHAILTSDQTHALLSDIESAKEILKLPVYGRLLKIDELVKNKVQLEGLLFAFRQIASGALLRSSQMAKADNIRRWHQLYREIYLAEQRLLNSTAPKLVLTDMFLHM